MSVYFTSRHTSITPEIEKYCERRVQSLEKLLGYPLETHLILSVEKYRNIVEITVKTKKATLNALGETQDMFNSLGVAFNIIEKRVKKEKEKLRGKKRRKNKEVIEVAAPSSVESRETKVIRKKNYSLKPMPIDEALLMFESGSEEVFVFRKSDTERWAVLYRRNDGNIGLIDPE